ncbi:MAG: hypothetical protein ACFCD0_00145 [Gemmataceae bacterium]
MIDGPSITQALVDCGITHVIWIPDSVMGTWESSLLGSSQLQLVRVCREGEAFAVAAGLYLGGKQPFVMIQCTGLFEAGDSLRNIVHDLKLPLFVLIGLRSYKAHKQGTTKDSCPVFAEPILKAWQMPYTILDDQATAEDLKSAYQRAQEEQRSGAVFLPE